MPAVELSAVARVLGINVAFKDMRSGSALFLPQRIAIFAQGNAAATYGTTKRQITSAAEVASAENGGAGMGWGSPAHLIARELFPDNGDGIGTVGVDLYPLAAPGGGAATAAGTITPAGTQTRAASYRARCGGIQSDAFVVPAGATVADRVALVVAAVNATLAMPVIATNGTTNVGIAAKWAGLSGNDILVEIIAADPNAGTTWAIVQPTGGLVNPSLTAALAQVGNVWESMALSALNFDDTTVLNDFQTFGEGRWGETVRKPLVVFHGSTKSDATNRALTSARPTDRVNSLLPAIGSPNLPFVAAAAMLVRIARRANNNPAFSYGSLGCPTIIPGADSSQLNYTQRDVTVKAGCSTIEVEDGVVRISDVVTMYRPTGENPPAYRKVVNIVKLQSCIYNYDLKFRSAEWDGAPMIPDDQPTKNKDAKKPKIAKADADAITDALADAAIISNPKATKAATVVTLGTGGNPDRWDLDVPFQLSGNSDVKNVNLTFGFFFG
jgi:phage tail sheath gpL-like